MPSPEHMPERVAKFRIIINWLDFSRPVILKPALRNDYRNILFLHRIRYIFSPGGNYTFFHVHELL